jgi:molybdopterin synthase sulfur carrier subunit
MRMRVYASLRDLLGTSSIDMPLETPQGGVSTVGQVLERLTARYPALAEKLWDADHDLAGYVMVLLNGRSVEFLQGVDTPIADDDVIALFPPVGGG